MDAVDNVIEQEAAAAPTPLLDHVEKEEIDPTTLNYEQERRMRLIPFRPATAGVLKYRRIPSCGHKFVPGREPRHRNCESCWFTFFQVHGELVRTADEIHKQFGVAGLRQLKGPKFTKNFTRFMSTIAQWRKTAEEAAARAKEENGEQDTGGLGEGNGTTVTEPSIGGTEIGAEADNQGIQAQGD